MPNQSCLRHLPRLACGAVVLLALWPASTYAADWPTYRHDNRRSGVTAEKVALPLAECWVFRPRHAPEPAWDGPNPRRVGGWYGLVERRRMHFDDAFHVVVAGRALYFGSSANGKVYSLDVDTGRVRWSALTGGPVRLTPTVWQGRLYVGSDDGYAYCLRAEDGGVVWSRLAGPDRGKLLGSGKMISRWPLRTGVLVDGGIAYFGAGIFPAEGVYLYAVRAEDGKIAWRNDTCADHPSSRISPQGYLLASKTLLFAPMARTTPGAFDRKTGGLVHQTWFGHRIGGAYALLADDLLYTGTEEVLGYRSASRGKFAWFEGRQLIVTPDTSYMTSDRAMAAVSRKTYPKASARRFVLREQRPALKQKLGSATGLHRSAQAAVKSDQGKLAAIDKQLAALGKEAGKDKTAALDAQRSAIEKSLAVSAAKLEEAAKALEAMEQSYKAAEDEFKRCAVTMTASAQWRLECECPDSLILAGNVLYAGGQDHVIGVDAATGRKLWTGKVDGKAMGIAAAAGRLFVSTDKGSIHCFGPAGSKQPGLIEPPASARPHPRDALTPAFEAAADHIVRATGIKRGYCLVLGCGTGRLAVELAKRTELQFCAVEPDARKFEAARRAFDAAGFYGSRICIEQADLSSVPYSDYFANLIVSETALLTGEPPGAAEEAFRLLKPWGGMLCIGQPAEAKGLVKPAVPAELGQWLERSGIRGGQVSQDRGVWLKLARGPLPGAGSWTHQYAEPGNTTCSDDQLVKCPLGLLWFGAPGPREMAGRHRRAAAPLAINGRLFVQGEGSSPNVSAGENVLMAYDACNGVKLWERRVPARTIRVGVSTRASNLAADATSIYVVSGTQCLRLDAATGAIKTKLKMPQPAKGQTRTWGYVANSGSLLFGSHTAGKGTCDSLFALDVETGKCRWVHAGKSIPHSSISIGDGRVFFVDDAATAPQRREALREKLAGMSATQAAAAMKTAPVRLAVALDASTGKPVWQRPFDLTGAIGGAYWSALGTMYSRGVLVVFGVFTDGHFWKQFFAGQFGSRRITALSARDGQPLWAKNIGYRVRPLIVGDTLHAEPWAYDLRTGEQQTRLNPVTGLKEPWQFARPGHHCGCPAACPNVMLFRSGCIGYYDLAGDYGTMHFGGQRPGCWINFVPANGLLLIPEGSSGCMCPFPLSCTVAFKHRERNRAWAYYSMPGAVTPVKHLALNLGALGDRRDSAGTLWMGYPRPGGALVLRFKVGVSGWPGGGYFRQSPDFVQIDGTDSPWLYTSGFRGLRRCEVPLFPPEDGAALYTVRLGFADLENDKPGQRVFDIKLNGKLALKGFDLVKEADGQCKGIVKEFKGIEGGAKLSVDLAATIPKPTPQQLPILQTIEIIRERVLTLGFTAPSFLLSSDTPEQAGEVHIANHKDDDFVGTLHIDAAEGFALTPSKTAVKVACGDTTTVALKAAVVKAVPKGMYAAKLRLVREDGKLECERSAQIEYLADHVRVTLNPVEDVHCQQNCGTRNMGSDPAFNIDGGDRKLGDHHHAVAYMKFRLDVPGKPTSLMLRLFNAGNPSGNSGHICLVTDPWSEKTATYPNRPKVGRELAKIGTVSEHQVVELPIKLDLAGKAELSLAIEPTGCDGINYYSREGSKPPELVVEYQQKP